MNERVFSQGAVLTALAASGLVIHALAYDFLSDDALIVARYARNIVEGNGWVWNVGERVEGYTSVLSVAATALLGALGVDFVLAVRALSLTGALAAMVLCWGLAPAIGIPRASPWAALAPALVAATGSVACWALGGLEACGFAALVLAATGLAAGSRDRPPRYLGAAGLVAGLTALMRPEGIALVALGAFWVWLDAAGAQRWRRSAIFAGAALALPVAHLGWRLSYYGEWLPNTFYAKVGSSTAQVERGWWYLLSFVAEHGAAAVWLVPLVAVLFLSGPAGRFTRRLATVALVLTAGVVAVGGDGLPMYRFLIPIIPLWALLTTAWIRALYQLAVLRGPARRGPYATLTGVVVVLIAVPLWVPDRESSSFLAYAFQREVEIPRWRAVGEWLAENSPPNASVAVVPIGAIGYYSNRTVIDMVGLVDRHIAQLPIPIGGGWAGHEKHDGSYVLSRRPDYLLLGNVRVTDEPIPFDHPQFLRPPNRSIQTREADIFRAELEQLYQRRRVVLPNGQYLHFMQRRPEGDVAKGHSPGPPT